MEEMKLKLQRAEFIENEIFQHLHRRRISQHGDYDVLFSLHGIYTRAAPLPHRFRC